MGWVEWTATLLGIAYVLLMIRRNILCWVAGNISVALQAVSFWEARLYADMLLQGVYFAMGCYGWWLWWKQSPEAETKPIGSLRQRRTWSRLVLIWIGGSLVWAAMLRNWTNAAIPEVDAALASASLVATWMQAHRYLENWLLWIVIDSAYALVYWTRGLHLYVVLYGIFVVLAWQGWKEWNRLLDEYVAAAG